MHSRYNATVRRPLLLGHRGARATRSLPENTLPSFDRALEHGCDGFEFDVRLTADDAPVICHDPAWRSPESSASRRKIIIASARRDELPSIPLLSQVIERYRTSAFLDIELKVAGLGTTFLSALRLAKAGPGLVVSSFLPEALLEVNRADPSLPLGLICETSAQLKSWTRLPVSFVIPNYRILTVERMNILCSAGKQVLVWTVNNSEDMRRLADLGVAGIISDDTELLVQTLGQPE